MTSVAAFSPSPCAVTDFDAKELRLLALVNSPCIGSVWRDGTAHWQVFDLTPAVDKFGQIVHLTKVYSNGRSRAGTTMTTSLLRQRMVPAGIMPVGSI